MGFDGDLLLVLKRLNGDGIFMGFERNSWVGLMGFVL